MPQLLALARDLDRIELLDLSSGGREVIITETGPHPDGVVCDGTTIYWSTMGRRTGVTATGEAIYADVDGGIHAIDVNGENRRDIVAPGETTTGKQLALDSQGRIYWGNREGFTLSAINTDGTGHHDLVVRDGSGGERDWIVGVAVDEANGHLYWTQKGSFAGGDGRIFRAGLEVPAGETADHRSDIELLWDNLPAPIDLELNAGRLFWTDRGTQPGGNSLNRAAVPAAGEKGGAPTILADGFEAAIGLAVDSASQVAYVADLAGRIWVVPGPGNPETEPRVGLDMGFALTGLNLVTV